jgi:two-component system chemotaxis response regulator CheB
VAFELVVVGTSLGGLHALEVLLAGLPDDFPASVAIVQHRHKDSQNTLSFFLQQHSALPLKEPEDKEVIVPGHIYLAPADYHLLVEAPDCAAEKHRPYFSLSTEAPVEYARPSIDVLFESAADAYTKKVIGVILTGSNQDGAQGLAKIKARGGLTVVQAPTTAESSLMPEAALAKALRGDSAQSEGIATATVDRILLLSEIAPFVVNLVNRRT